MRQALCYVLLGFLLLMVVACDPTGTVPSPAPSASQAPATTGTPLGALPTTEAGEPIVARVNDVPILKRDFDRQLAAAQSFVKDQGVDPASDKGREMLQGIEGQVLDSLIDQEIVSQAAAQRFGIDVSDAELQAKVDEVVTQQGGPDKFRESLEKGGMTHEDFVRDLRAQLIWQKMSEKIGQSVPDRAEQVHVRHIQLADEATAQDVLQRLKAGQDFAALARQYSQDLSSRDQGGDLGWLPRGVMVLQLEAVVFSLPLNQFSDPVQTPTGYHILQVLGKEADRPIDPHLLDGMRQEAFMKWLSLERGRARIERYLAT
jgi:foldase protein PrsA